MDNLFIFFRPVIALLLFIALVNFLYAAYYQSRVRPEWFVILNSFLLLFVTVLLLVIEGFLVDIFSMVGDSVTTFFGAGVLVVFILTLFYTVFYAARKK